MSTVITHTEKKTRAHTHTHSHTPGSSANPRLRSLDGVQASEREKPESRNPTLLPRFVRPRVDKTGKIKLVSSPRRVRERKDAWQEGATQMNVLRLRPLACNVSFLFFNFVIGSQSGDDPHKDLAQYGYKLNIEIVF